MESNGNLAEDNSVGCYEPHKRKTGNKASSIPLLYWLPFSEPSTTAAFLVCFETKAHTRTAKIIIMYTRINTFIYICARGCVCVCACVSAYTRVLFFVTRRKFPSSARKQIKKYIKTIAGWLETFFFSIWVVCHKHVIMIIGPTVCMRLYNNNTMCNTPRSDPFVSNNFFKTLLYYPRVKL